MFGVNFASLNGKGLVHMLNNCNQLRLGFILALFKKQPAGQAKKIMVLNLGRVTIKCLLMLNICHTHACLSFHCNYCSDYVLYVQILMSLFYVKINCYCTNSSDIGAKFL